MEIDEAVRQALFAAIPILEKLPDAYRPRSNIENMREVLAGRSSGRDGYIITEALATALAYRTSIIVDEPVEPPVCAEAFTHRLHEFCDLFTVVARIDPWTFAVCFSQACDRMAASRRVTACD
jgi:hypothetical protein